MAVRSAFDLLKGLLSVCLSRLPSRSCRVPRHARSPAAGNSLTSPRAPSSPTARSNLWRI